MRKRLSLVVGLMTVFGFVAAPPAHADALLSMQQGTHPGGTIAWSGIAGTPLIGTNIPIYLLNASSTTGIGHPGDHAITGTDPTYNLYGVLNFQSGAFSGYSDSNGGAGGGVVQYTFLGGGSFSIVGGVPDAAIANGTTLLSGALTTPVTMMSQSNGFNILSGFGADTKNSALLDYFYLPLSAVFSFSVTTNDSGSLPNTLGCTPGTAGCGAFSVIANLTSVNNSTDAIAILPEPASLLLLGSGLAGLGGTLKRRRQQQKAA